MGEERISTSQKSPIAASEPLYGYNEKPNTLEEAQDPERFGYTQVNNQPRE